MEPAPHPIEPPAEMGRQARHLVKRLLVAVVVLVAVAVVYLAARIVFYRQIDDDQRTASKNAYLERVNELTGGSPAGPNLVVILFDDLGLGDIGAYGSEAIKTPNLDRLASQGLLFRYAYSSSPYCSASRAGLLTGRYAVHTALDHVLQVPGSWQDTLERMGGLNRRLPAEEITLAEVLKYAGYVTAVVGKWHLGDESPSLPNDMGFDSFYGLLFSNDQGEPVVWSDREIVENHPVDQETLTRRYTERAVEFIETNRDRPFFLYLPHTFPHVPLHVASDRRGRSAAGLYGDVVEELDWSTGSVLDAIVGNGIAENTLVVVTSDNGPWFQGSPGGLRGRKLDIFEGGMRVPFLAWWPGVVEPGRVDLDMIIGIDLFPTFLELAGLPPPPDRVIDGQSFAHRLEGRDGEARGPIWYHQIGHLRAVREGRFKYHDRHRVPFGNPSDFPFGFHIMRGPWLFDLELDPAESYDVSHRHPETFRRMGKMLEARRRELEENPRGWR
jgi:arylsulfatase A-like enzyme